MATARIVTTRDQIATALATITTGNGYQNTVKNVSKAIVHPSLVTDYPHIGMELGKSVITVQNDVRTLFNEVTEVFIVGFVSANTEPTLDIASITNLQDSMESLIWDLKKLLATLLVVNVAHATNPWNVVFTKGSQLVFERDMYLGHGTNIGIVKTDFTIMVRNMDGSFDD